MVERKFRTTILHKKLKRNGQNDIMTEGRTRYMMVRVVRGD